MVPAGIHILGSLPLTPNGKVDRRVLAQLESPKVPDAPPDSPQDSDVELCVIDEVTALLGGLAVRPRDRLMDVGADSLMIVQLANRLEVLFGNRPPLDLLLRNPSVAELARSCTTQGAAYLRGKG
jgi:acyl carrier protein